MVVRPVFNNCMEYSPAYSASGCWPSWGSHLHCISSIWVKIALKEVFSGADTYDRYALGRRAHPCRRSVWYLVIISTGFSDTEHFISFFRANPVFSLRSTGWFPEMLRHFCRWDLPDPSLPDGNRGEKDTEHCSPW